MPQIERLKEEMQQVFLISSDTSKKSDESDSHSKMELEKQTTAENTPLNEESLSLEMEFNAFLQSLENHEESGIVVNIQGIIKKIKEMLPSIDNINQLLTTNAGKVVTCMQELLEGNLHIL